MRDTYPINDFYNALDAWEVHKIAYLKRLGDARQQIPSADALRSYMHIWIEGYMESQADAKENINTSS